MKIIEKAFERFDLPLEAIGHGRIILSGNSHLMIENHRGVLEYTEELVLIALKKGRLRVRGSGLSLAAIEGESVAIVGKIQAVELE